MAENETKTNPEGGETPPILTPEEQLLEYKKNMVPKAEAEEAKRKYNELFAKVLNGEFSERVPQGDGKGDQDLEKEARDALNELASHKVRSGCRIAQDLLKLDDYRIAKGQRSIFEPSGGDRDLNGARESAKRCRELIEYALEEANGDDHQFTLAITGKLRDVN